jgi:SAM-dependent methyltransferase
VSQTVTPRLHNRTRRSRSIPLSLLRRGRLLDLPLYWLLRLSDLAREGLDHSGSFRFADHIYRGEPSGRGPVGRKLDALLLSLPAAQSFRFRYLAARDEIVRFVTARAGGATPLSIDILSAPCGIPREMADAAEALRARSVPLDGVRFHGLDLDSDVLHEAEAFAAGRGLRPFSAHRGDALERSSYPARADVITSTGLAEFLDDATLARLFAIFYDVLAPEGVLVTSGMQRRRFSDYLLRLAEIPTQYRGPADLVRLARRLPFRDVATRMDPNGLQTILVARK